MGSGSQGTEARAGVLSSGKEAAVVTQPHRSRDIYGGADPRSLAAYPLVEAAHYLDLRPSTLGSWFRDSSLLPSDAGSEQLSFWNLVEAFVLKGLREEHRMSMQRIRVAVADLRRRYPKLPHPLAQLELSVLNRDLYVDEGVHLVDASRGGQLGIRGVLALYLSRVDRDVSGATRLHPFTRPRLDESPRVVAIDPGISFGRPVITGTSIPTAVLHERWKAGDSITDLAEDYDRPVAEIEEALRYEAA